MEIGIYENVIKYCQEVIQVVKKDDKLMFHQNIKETMNLLEESVEDINEEIEISKDCDAKRGHKTAYTNFFGYKIHIAMTPERIITAATVTTGEKADGNKRKTDLEFAYNKDTQKSKTYSVTLKMSDIHQEHYDKQETPIYKELALERYKIEAKNAEIKNQYGYAHSFYARLHGMTLQAGVSIFVVNLKRILRLKNGNIQKNE